MDKNKITSYIFCFLLIVLYFLVGILGFPSESEMVTFASVALYYLIIGLIFISILIGVHFKDLKKDYHSFISHFKKNMKIVFKYILLLIIGYVFLKLFITILGAKSGNNQVLNSSELIYNAFFKYPAYVTFAVGIYTPFVEEMIFRKTLYQLISHKYYFLIISSIIFGFLHIFGNITGDFDLIQLLLLMIPYTYFGFILSYSYIKTKNIMVPILVHLLYSLFLIVGIAFLPM